MPGSKPEYDTLRGLVGNPTTPARSPLCGGECQRGQDKDEDERSRDPARQSTAAAHTSVSEVVQQCTEQLKVFRRKSRFFGLIPFSLNYVEQKFQLVHLHLCSSSHSYYYDPGAGAVEVAEGAEPAAKTSTPAPAASGTSPASHLHSDAVARGVAATSASPTVVDCRAAPPNTTAVSILESLSEEERNTRLIIHVATEGSVQDVWALVAAGADVRARDTLQMTALNWAARKGHAAVVGCLLDAGAPVDARNTFRETPLHDAAGGGHVEVVRALLAAGADVNATDDLGFTPLHQAARKGHAAVVGCLLQAGALVDARDGFRETPLHEAARGGQAEVVAALLAAGADKRARSHLANTPLDVARLNGHHHLTELLT